MVPSLVPSLREGMARAVQGIPNPIDGYELI